MYQQYFGLNEAPFSLTPDTSFFYSNGDHQQALSTLLVALQMGEGFIKVTGEVGTGKTLICRKLLKELAADEHVVTAYIPNPSVNAISLRYSLADELGISFHRNMGQHHVMRLINQCLVEHKVQGRQVVLIIDEAQALAAECLEAVRLLTNLETEKSKLLHVVLFGQPELDEHLQKPSARQLRQRITFTHRLVPMQADVIKGYLAHRLCIAGYHGPEIFAEKLARRLYQASDGIPRLINILAHKCLLVAYGEGKAEVSKRHLKRAIEDTESLHTEKSGGLRRLWFSMASVVSVAAAFGVFWIMGSG